MKRRASQEVVDEMLRKVFRTVQLRRGFTSLKKGLENHLARKAGDSTVPTKDVRAADGTAASHAQSQGEEHGEKKEKEGASSKVESGVEAAQAPDKTSAVEAGAEKTAAKKQRRSRFGSGAGGDSAHNKPRRRREKRLVLPVTLTKENIEWLLPKRDDRNESYLFMYS